MRRVAEFLRKQGITVWVDNEWLKPGTRAWEAEIEKAIPESYAVVVLLSPDAKSSEWVRREITLADQNLIKIYPVLIRGTENNAIFLRLIASQYIDLREKQKEDGLNSLFVALSSCINEIDHITAETIAKEKAEREVAEKATNEDLLSYILFKQEWDFSDENGWNNYIEYLNGGIADLCARADISKKSVISRYIELAKKVQDPKNRGNNYKKCLELIANTMGKEKLSVDIFSNEFIKELLIMERVEHHNEIVSAVTNLLNQIEPQDLMTKLDKDVEYYLNEYRRRSGL